MNVLRRSVEIAGVKRSFDKPVSRVPGSMSAFTESGHSDYQILCEVSGCLRPLADIQVHMITVSILDRAASQAVVWRFHYRDQAPAISRNCQWLTSCRP